MAGDRTLPSETVTRGTDDEVGSSGNAATAGGKQTPQQAAITEMGAGGRDETERRDLQDQAGSSAARNPKPVGGASQGHAEQKSTADRSGEESAKGHYKVEQKQD